MLSDKPFAVDTDSPLGYYVIGNSIIGVDEMSPAEFGKILSQWHEDQCESIINDPDDGSWVGR